jgi:hypothetical protein
MGMSEVRGIYAPRALHRQIRAAAREMVSVTRSHQNDDRALLAERDRLAAALEAARGDAWQPIETAPRDGTTVMVYFKGHGAMTVAWEDPWGDGPEAATWCVTDHKHGSYPVRGYRTGDDTHWRPLPAPPAIDQARGEGWKEDSND